MPTSQRQTRKQDAKQTPPTTTVKTEPARNSNLWFLAVVFALLIFYVLYNSISIYTKDRMYNDFE